MKELFLEDFTIGQTFGSGCLRIDAAASGWHTAALTMRLLVESEFKPAGGVVGAGLEELRWPRPVRPGDELRVETEILEIRPSRSRPEQGIVKVKVTTRNQESEALQIYIANLVVQCRRNRE